MESETLELEIESLNNDTLVATSTASAQIFDSKFHSPKKGTTPLGKMADFKAVAGKVQDEPEQLVPEIKGLLKNIKRTKEPT